MKFKPSLRFVPVILSLYCLSWQAFATAADVDPEAATGVAKKHRVDGKSAMVVSANPLASAAGAKMLDAGGSATDAAIAMQLMLGLVEPQSSGIGGGLFMLHFGSKTGKLQSIDGRETAPKAAHPDWFVEHNKVMDWRRAYVGGKSVGSPGVIRALYQAHQQWGKLPWATLFEPAIQTAEQGFVVSPRLAMLLDIYQDGGLSHFSASKAYFYPDGKALQAGHLLKNQPYADILRKIAKEGDTAFYQGDNAKALVAAVNTAPVNPGKLSPDDLSGYQALMRDPLCRSYRQYKVCGMAPPSSGSLAVLQILGMLEQFDMAALKPNSVQALHLFAQASRLAFADRERFLADPAFSKVPVQGLLAADYLRKRAAQINVKRDAAVVEAGEPKGAEQLQSSKAVEFDNTSHLSVVDKDGNAVSMTTSIENAFGSGILVNGYLLNNQLTDFSLDARKDGVWVANRVEAGKRPRSSMAPMMVFNTKGELLMLAGSPGGSRIIDYVAQALVAMIDWQLDPQQAADLAKVTHRNDFLALEQGTELENLLPQLRELGYQPKLVELNSGLHLIKKSADGWQGGADPRREGHAIAK
ncbi:gamma-glutamyltransferase [Rheinheimera sp. 4Y26]|uniref:gamma-glutamyltransferase n=1 Tax=Rheinheimera sp. 4Y26 TaxID=2977811 RepID=UPI0021B1095E|nr:gamma-glutamyltransferase [Rheinheimera sp. 4Y26]MCT6700822.1 gamma-glutamyltransferase [Rheinheimera sp. 4Y26]